jgi:hypothetical protein
VISTQSDEQFEEFISRIRRQQPIELGALEALKFGLQLAGVDFDESKEAEFGIELVAKDGRRMVVEHFLAIDCHEKYNPGSTWEFVVYEPGQRPQLETHVLAGGSFRSDYPLPEGADGTPQHFIYDIVSRVSREATCLSYCPFGQCDVSEGDWEDEADEIG